LIEECGADQKASDGDKDGKRKIEPKDEG